MRFRETNPVDLDRARAAVAAWREQHPAGTEDQLTAALGPEFHPDYGPVLRAVLFIHDRHQGPPDHHRHRPRQRPWLLDRLHLHLDTPRRHHPRSRRRHHPGRPERHPPHCQTDVNPAMPQSVSRPDSNPTCQLRCPCHNHAMPSRLAGARPRMNRTPAKPPRGEPPGGADPVG